MDCGEVAVLPVTRSGRTSPYRNMQSVEIPADFPIPTCTRCGAEWIDEDTAEGLDRVLENSYRQALRERMRRSIEVISKHVSQRRLETLLGISQGYLSKLRTGDRDPSPELV